MSVAAYAAANVDRRRFVCLRDICTSSRSHSIMAQSRSRDASPSDDAHAADDDVDAKMGDDYNFESTSSSSSFSPLLNVDDAFLDDEHTSKTIQQVVRHPAADWGSENGAASSSLDYYEFDDDSDALRVLGGESQKLLDDVHRPVSESAERANAQMASLEKSCVLSLRNRTASVCLSVVVVIIITTSSSVNTCDHKWRRRR